MKKTINKLLMVLIICLSFNICFAANPKISSVKMDSNSVSVTINETTKVYATISSGSLSKDDVRLLMTRGDIWWKSSNTNILKVESADSANGKSFATVRGLATGNATLQLITSNGYSASCKVSVVKKITNPDKNFKDIRGSFEIMPFTGFSCLDLAPNDYRGLHANADEIIQQIADAKITTIVLNNNRGYSDDWNDQVMGILIKKFEKKNIKVLVDDYRIRALLSDLDNINNYRYNSDRDFDTLKGLVNKYSESEYKNVLGFYIFDEPGINGFETISEFTRDINTITQNKKEVYINLFPNYAFANQLKGTDGSKVIGSMTTFRNYYDDYLLKFVKGSTAVPTSILSFDHYSTYFTDSKGSLSDFYQNLLNVLSASRASSTKNIPMNYIIIVEQTIGGVHYRNLNINEIAYQASANLALGMKRLGYYACITDPNGIAKSNTALFNYNSNRSSDSAIGMRRSPTTQHYDMVSDINNKWAYNLGVELYKKDLQLVYELSSKNYFSKYTSSSEDYKNIGNIKNSEDGVLISTFDDKSFLLVNTNFTKNNVITFNDLSNYNFFDFEQKKWVNTSNKTFKYSSKNGSSTYLTLSLSNNTVTLAPGHCILMKQVKSNVPSNVTTSAPKVTPKPTAKTLKTTPKPTAKTLKTTPKPVLTPRPTTKAVIIGKQNNNSGAVIIGNSNSKKTVKNYIIKGVAKS